MKLQSFFLNKHIPHMLCIQTYINIYAYILIYTYRLIYTYILMYMPYIPQTIHTTQPTHMQ